MQEGHHQFISPSKQNMRAIIYFKYGEREKHVIKLQNSLPEAPMTENASKQRVPTRLMHPYLFLSLIPNQWPGYFSGKEDILDP